MPDAEPAILDYAPPQRRLPWLTSRRAMWVALVLAALASALLVYPRLQQQSIRVRAQAALLSNASNVAMGPIADATWYGILQHEGRINAFTPHLSTFTQWAGPRRLDLAAFSGGRDAGNGERLVVVSSALPTASVLGQGRGLQLVTLVYEPGSWLSRPNLVKQSVDTVLLPTELGTLEGLQVFVGTPVAGDAATFLIPLSVKPEGASKPSLYLLQGTLLRNGLVAYAVVKPADPDAAPPATRKSSKLTGDDPVAQPSAGGAP